VIDGGSWGKQASAPLWQKFEPHPILITPLLSFICPARTRHKAEIFVDMPICPEVLLLQISNMSTNVHKYPIPLMSTKCPSMRVSRAEFEFEEMSCRHCPSLSDTFPDKTECVSSEEALLRTHMKLSSFTMKSRSPFRPTTCCKHLHVIVCIDQCSSKLGFKLTEWRQSNFRCEVVELSRVKSETR
jgi:hypothetical protein